MLKALTLAGLIGIIVAGPTPSAVAAVRYRVHHVMRIHVAPRYVPGQIYNYNTVALRHWRLPCCCCCCR